MSIEAHTPPSIASPPSRGVGVLCTSRSRTAATTCQRTASRRTGGTSRCVVSAATSSSVNSTKVRAPSSSTFNSSSTTTLKPTNWPTSVVHHLKRRALRKRKEGTNNFSRHSRMNQFFILGISFISLLFKLFGVHLFWILSIVSVAYLILGQDKKQFQKSEDVINKFDSFTSWTIKCSLNI